MATYGAFASAIKASYGDLTQVAANGSNISVDISTGIVGAQNPRAGATYIVCEITTSGDTLIQIGDPATANSMFLGASDVLICSVATDRVIGVWGDGVAPTVTIKRFVV